MVKMAASVLAVNNDGTLLLQAGKMKMTVKAQQVRLPEGQRRRKKPAAPACGGSPKLNLQSRAASELDIRGYETLEAESVVENYIDSAVMAKLGTVTIIHGKGTGALRKAVHEMLQAEQGRQELPPGPLWRGRGRRNGGGAEITDGVCGFCQKDQTFFQAPLQEFVALDIAFFPRFGIIL